MSEPADVEVRPLAAGDVEQAQRISYEALREAGQRYGWQMPAFDEAVEARWRSRVEHLLRTDPDGSWVAVHDGRVVGLALATRRGPLWFLSLLTVEASVQGSGVGGRLLAQAHRTAEDAAAGLIVASSDPKALRRYGRLGFALHPGYAAKGTLDRALLPAVRGVREGDWSRDGELVDDLALRLRGAAYGPDLQWWAGRGERLLVADDGFAVLRAGGVVALGAATPSTAADLLWSALAEAPGEVELDGITGAQQWAVEVGSAGPPRAVAGRVAVHARRRGPADALPAERRVRLIRRRAAPWAGCGSACAAGATDRASAPSASSTSNASPYGHTGSSARGSSPTDVPLVDLRRDVPSSCRAGRCRAGRGPTGRAGRGRRAPGLARLLPLTSVRSPAGSGRSRVGQDDEGVGREQPPDPVRAAAVVW